jgi:iron complex transport system substrate-binding protein
MIKNKTLLKFLAKLIFLPIVLGFSLQYSASAANFPKRIVSLSPSATEDLFAIGAGKQVIAVDDNSNFPIGVPTTKLSSFNPNSEAIAKYKPDLVIIQSTATKSAPVVKQLKTLKIKVYVEKTPSDLTGLFKEISDLGALTGNINGAKKINASISKARLQALSRTTKKGVKIFHELDNTLYSATSDTFIGKVYSDFGLINIADAAAKADDGGYPQLQNEYIIAANPKYIFLADANYGEDPAKVAGRPGWNSIDAVKNQRVVSLPSDISSRWGPRIADFYKLIADALS